MNWEELTDSDFAKAVKETNLCVLPLGVLERHADHLPLGTDSIVAHAVASEAARREKAVVFPVHHYTQIYEGMHYPGAIAIKPHLMLELLENICDEIGRNGFGKILIYNGHGGNMSLVRFFAQCVLHQPKPYTLYHVDWLADWSRQKEVETICPTPGGHADETETSCLLAVAPHLAKMERCKTVGRPRGKLRHLPGVNSPHWWFADYPTFYAGDGKLGSVEKGKKVMEIYVQALARAIKMVKADKTAPALQRQFFKRVEKVRKTRPGRR